VAGSALGLESGTVRVVPYDPDWPILFRDEARRIAEAIAPLPIRVEHTGSTAVPGLAAKPVLDILGGYPAGSTVKQYVERIVSCGYVHRGDQGIAGREFFRRGVPRAYHLHLAEIDSPFWRDHLAFRNYLRMHADLRDEYSRLKLALAADFPNDRESYIERKSDFVQRVLKAASQSRDV
jgi:GrpB-like predicted nucleotidyltransferase (UPF0157 family)